MMTRDSERRRREGGGRRDTLVAAPGISLLPRVKVWGPTRARRSRLRCTMIRMLYTWTFRGLDLGLGSGTRSQAMTKHPGRCRLQKISVALLRPLSLPRENRKRDWGYSIFRNHGMQHWDICRVRSPSRHGPGSKIRPALDCLRSGVPQEQSPSIQRCCPPESCIRRTGRSSDKRRVPIRASPLRRDARYSALHYFAKLTAFQGRKKLMSCLEGSTERVGRKKAISLSRQLHTGGPQVGVTMRIVCSCRHTVGSARVSDGGGRAGLLDEKPYHTFAQRGTPVAISWR